MVSSKWLWDRITDTLSAWQVWVLIAPAVISAATFVSGQLAGLPLYLTLLYAIAALCAVALTVAAILHSLVQLDELRGRRNVRDKLKITPTHWLAKAGEAGEFLSELQLGVTIRNEANFPITYRVLNLRTSFDNTTIVSHNFPWPNHELLSLETSTSRDTILHFENKPFLQIYAGTLEYKIAYWRTGRKRTYTVDKSFTLEFRLDLPHEEMFWFEAPTAAPHAEGSS
jgi:hypothetical protein